MNVNSRSEYRTSHCQILPGLPFVSRKSRPYFAVALRQSGHTGPGDIGAACELARGERQWGLILDSSTSQTRGENRPPRNVSRRACQRQRRVLRGHLPERDHGLVVGVGVAIDGFRVGLRPESCTDP